MLKYFCLFVCLFLQTLYETNNQINTQNSHVIKKNVDVFALTYKMISLLIVCLQFRCVLGCKTELKSISIVLFFIYWATINDDDDDDANIWLSDTKTNTKHFLNFFALGFTLGNLFFVYFSTIFVSILNTSIYILFDINWVKIATVFLLS